MELCLPGREEPLSRYSIFSDESSQTGHGYMILGALSASRTAIPLFEREIEIIREQSRFPGDSLQWKNINSKKLYDYERLVNLFLDWNREHAIDFTAATFQRKRYKHNQFNDGDSEVAYQKWLCSVYLAVGAKYGWPDNVHCMHGKRDSRFKLSEIREILNARAARKVRYNYLPYRCLEYRDPSYNPILQMNDVLLGAVSYYWNAGMRKLPNSPKSEMARYIQANCCAADLGKKTPMSMPHFDIWEFRLT